MTRRFWIWYDNLREPWGLCIALGLMSPWFLSVCSEQLWIRAAGVVYIVTLIGLATLRKKGHS